MSERLNELLRQRALLQQHLAWLDKEIEGAAGSQPNIAPSPAKPIVPAPPLPAQSLPIIRLSADGLSSPTAVPKLIPNAPAAAAVAPAEQILDQYRVDSRNLKQDVRKGCFLYFVGAFVVLGVVVAALYFAISSR